MNPTMTFTDASALDPDLDVLLDALVRRLHAGLAGRKADLAFLFVGAEHAGGVGKIQERLLDALGGVRIVGCTAGGVIGQGREYERAPAVSVLAGTLPGAAVHTFRLGATDLPDPDSPPHAWHQALGVSPADHPSFVVLPDPASFPIDALLSGLDYAWPGAVTLGGVAGGSRPEEALLLLDDHRPRSGGAVGVALMGDIVLEPAVAQGCRPIGRPLCISECEEHLLTGLDGRAPLDVLRETVAAGADPLEGLAGHILLLGFEMDPFAGDHEGPWLVRPLIGIDRESRGLVVGETLRRGRRVRFHLRDRRTSHDDLERTLDAAGRDGGPAAALLFSCLGRGVHLYGRPHHDVGVFSRHFGDVPMAGFFCNGEIGPVGGRTHVHGFTSAFGLIHARRAEPGSTG